MSSKTKLTFSEGAVEVIVEAFGWKVSETGYILTEGGANAPTADGAPIQVDEVAGVVTSESGDPMLLRDDFVSLVEHVKLRGNPT